MNESDLLALFERVQRLENRVRELEKKQIDPYSIVSFTAVAVSGDMKLRPIQMDLLDRTNVSAFGLPVYRENVKLLQQLAKRCKLL